MYDTNVLLEKLQEYGVGRRRLVDGLFGCDRAPARLGIYDEDDNDLCHKRAGDERGARAGYSCSQCRRALPSPHLLHLHLQETHDSFFSVMAVRKPSYCCYIQECVDKFENAEDRLAHCIKVHKMPKDFRFEMKPKANNISKDTVSQTVLRPMDVDPAGAAASTACQDSHIFFFHNSKKKGLITYSGKTFTSNNNKPYCTTNMDEIMADLKENLPK